MRSHAPLPSGARSCDRWGRPRRRSHGIASTHAMRHGVTWKYWRGFRRVSMRIPVKIAALILLLAACRGERDEQPAPVTGIRTAASAESPAQSQPGGKPATVRAADGSEVLTVGEADDVVR